MASNPPSGQFVAPGAGGLPQQQQVGVEVHYSGILPTPAMFQGFENVVPGAADRILVMAEEEAKHRHWLDRRHVVYRFAGLAAGTVVALAGLLLAGYLVRQGESGWAAVAFISEIGVLAAIFVLGLYVIRNGKGNGG